MNNQAELRLKPAVPGSERPGYRGIPGSKGSATGNDNGRVAGVGGKRIAIVWPRKTQKTRRRTVCEDGGEVDW
jgi:hypothetical protein